MKVLNKTAIAVAVAVASSAAQAELKVLGDEALGSLTGQAGLTIDLETKYTIGEFMYKDAGSVFLQGISFGANENVDPGGLFDNVRVKLDIAGNGAIDGSGNADNYLDTGFSGVRKTAEIQGVAANAAGNLAEEATLNAASTGTIDVVDAQSAGLISANATTSGTMSIEDKKTYGDGDLLIHVSAKDYWEPLGGIETLLANGTLGDLTADQFFGDGFVKGKDFNFSIDAIGLASSAFEAGDSIGAADVVSSVGGTFDGTDSDASTTVLISDLSINGYLGPVDIHIENNGNGFSVPGAIDLDGNPIVGVGVADSKINWNTYVNVTDLDVYLDIAGVQITDLKINNVRGDVTDLDGNFAFGFAQSKRQIFAVRNSAGLNASGVLAAAAAGAPLGTIKNVLETMGNDGVAINTVFKGDMEIGALSFGDTGTSIGSLYWTDIESTTNWTISAH